MGKATDTDPIRGAADSLRERKGLQHGTAKLEASEEGEVHHVDYFRGKDLLRYIDSHPGKLDGVLKERAGRTTEDTATELIRTFYTRGLLYRTERKYKRPKPGRTRLVKWPRTLTIVRDPAFDPQSFYAWRYDRPTPLWYWLASVAVPVVVILACLFPLAPWWARIGLVYTLMTLLVIMLGLMFVRYLLFAVVWVLTGSALWIFPNLMSDQVGLLDAFKPPVTFKRTKSIADQWPARVATLLVLGGVFWVLASHSPDLTHLKDDLEKAHDSFKEYMENMSKDKGFLAGNTTTPGGPGSTGRPSAGSTSGSTGRTRPGP